MKITFTHHTALGRADDWQATAEGLPRSGIGKTTDGALASLVRANLAAFGITEVRTSDPFNEADPENCLAGFQRL